MSKIYKVKGTIKKVKIKAYRRGEKETEDLPFLICSIKTNKSSRNKAELDTKILEYLKNKKIINLEQNLKKLKIKRKELMDSINRLNRVSKLVKNKFVKEINIKTKTI